MLRKEIGNGLAKKMLTSPAFQIGKTVLNQLIPSTPIETLPQWIGIQQMMIPRKMDIG